jgi:hypothetical protein
MAGMEIDRLKWFLHETLTHAVETLCQTGQCPNVFHLFKSAGGVELCVLSSEVTASQEAKSVLARDLRARIDRGEIIAVVHVSDTTWTEMTPAQNEVRKSFDLTLGQAADAGLCQQWEAVIATLQTPIIEVIEMQRYSRDDPSDQRRITVGELMREDGQHTARLIPGGRFTGLFHTKARTA